MLPRRSASHRAAAPRSVRPSRPLSALSVRQLQARGAVQAVAGDAAALDARLAQGPVGVYAGFDPTAASLHAGHLLVIASLRRFADAGHRVVPLVGGATGRVGDPSGRSTDRPLLSEEELGRNFDALKTTLQRFFPRAEVVNNWDWLGSMGAIEFLRDVGRHYRVATILGRESVKARLESEHGLSFTELSYQLLQGYDFAHLHRTRGVCVQIGGSDQWGNICAGIDYIGRLAAISAAAAAPATTASAAPAAGTSVPAWGVTLPLMLGPDGSKLGKSSASGTVWLDAARTSPYDFYQYFVRTPDNLLRPYLSLLTALPDGLVDALLAEHARQPERRVAQAQLAAELTRWVHGDEAAAQAQRSSQLLFARPAPAADKSGGGGGGVSLTLADVESMAGQVPSASLPLSAIVGAALPQVAAEAGLCASKGEARRLLAGGGLYLNNKRVAAGQTVAASDLLEGKALLLRAGAKNYMIVRVKSE